MADKGIKTVILFAAAMACVSVAALLLLPGLTGMMLAALNIGAFSAEALIVRSSRPELLRRRLHMENWWDKFLIPVIVLLIAASAFLSVYDVLALSLSVLPTWTFLLGLVMLMSSYLIITQSLRARSPHAADKYGEPPEPEKKDRGPYEVIRHPMMLAVLIGGLSIPLFIGSGIGFIPAGLMAVAVVAWVAAEDDWRFNNFEWFYDYTKEVSYRLIPFIW